MTLEPSIVAPRAMPTQPMMRPMSEEAFIASRSSDVDDVLAADDVQGHVGAPPDARQAGLEDRGAPGADEVDDLLGALGDDQLGVGGEGHDGVGRRLDREDQVRIEVEVLFGMRKSVETDHVPVFGRSARRLKCRRAARRRAAVRWRARGAWSD